MFVLSIWLGLMVHVAHSNQMYIANWSSLDSRPLPKWFDEAKFGIYLHWGLFSVPSYASDHIWYYDRVLNISIIRNFMQKNYPEGFQYEQFAPLFKAEFFEPDAWADMLANSGAKYVIMNSNFLDGFAMWDSPYSNWTSVKTGPKRDLVEDFAKSIRKKPDLHFGLYYAQSEWFHPLYLQDKETKFTTTKFRDEKLRPEFKSLVEKFKPEIILVDGAAEAKDEYWNNAEVLMWLYNDSPVKETIVTNDNWHSTEPCQHGDFQTCEDRCQNLRPNAPKYRKWENSIRMDINAWSYRREANIDDFITFKKIISTLAKTVSCGGNLRLGVPPTPDGRITPLCQERLAEIGEWLKINGQAIYKSTAWHIQDRKDQRNGIWYTQRDCNVYAIFLNWPTKTDDLFLNAPEATKCTSVWLLGDETPIRYKPNKGGNGMIVRLPRLTSLPHLLSQPAWVLSLSNLSNIGHNCSISFYN